MNPASNHNNQIITQEVLFSGLFRQYEHRLYLLAFSLAKSEQVAKDIIQDVFMKLWEQRNNLDAIHNVEAWLYRLTENKVIDFLRKVADDDRLRNQIWLQVERITNEAELHVAAKEYNLIIQKAINDLPPQRRLIYKLNKEDGLNYQQIADELQISRHTVKNQLFFAVQSVRKFIARNTKLFFQFF